MMFKGLIFGCAIGLSALAPNAALATVAVTVNGTPCGGCATFAFGQWFVFVNGAGPEVVVSGDGGDTIQLIEIANTSALVAAELTVEGDVAEVGVIGPFVDEEAVGELWVIGVDADAVGYITANYIGAVTAASGDIFGDILQTGSALSGTSTGIFLLRSTSGGWPG